MGPRVRLSPRSPRLRALAGLVLGLALATAAGAQPVDPRTAPTDPPRVWCPELVADGWRVRAFDPVARRYHTGAALGWSTSSPRVHTTRGDTIAVGAEHQLSVSAGRRGRRTFQGALLGWAVAVGSIVADCGWGSPCGEQNPLPMLGGAVGAVIGSRMRREVWTRASVDGCPRVPPAPAPPAPAPPGGNA
jgi:hypothetical protein